MKMPKYSILDFLKYGGSFPLPTDLKGFKYVGQNLYDDPNTKVYAYKLEGKYCDFDFINDEFPFWYGNDRLIAKFSLIT